MSIDLNNYTERKAKGLIQIAKIGDAHAVAVMKFDEETGNPVAPEVAAVSRGELLVKKAALLKMVADIDEVIADMDALK